MEKRLESQIEDKERMETTLEKQEALWKEKYSQLEDDRNELIKTLEAEKSTNSKLWDLVIQKDRAIQQAFSRRFDPPHLGNRRAPSQRPSDRTTLSNQRVMSERHTGPTSHRNPNYYLEATGSTQSVQERYAVKSLNTFFGLDG